MGKPITLQFLGSGDAFGSGGRLQTCFYVQSEAATFLIDCGPSALAAMRLHDLEPNSIQFILLSHLHGDHFGGLPFYLIESRLVSKRKGPLTIAGPPGLEERIHQAREVFFPGSTERDLGYELSFLELAAGTPNEVGPLTVTPYEVVHPSGAPSYALRIECSGRTIAYSGDTEWTDALIPAAQGADLFIVEVNFYDKEVRYHMNYKALERNAERLGAKRVIMTHMGPEMLERAGSLDFECAEDGKIVEI